MWVGGATLTNVVDQVAFLGPSAMKTVKVQSQRCIASWWRSSRDDINIARGFRRGAWFRSGASGSWARRIPAADMFFDELPEEDQRREGA